MDTSAKTRSRITGSTTNQMIPPFFLIRMRIALGLLTIACLAGAGVGISSYGTAKTGVQASPVVAVHRNDAAPDLLPEPQKGDVREPIDPKLLTKLAKQLRSKNWDERSAALASLEKMVPAKGAGDVDFGPVIEPLLDLSGWGGIAAKDARRAEWLIVRMGRQTVLPLRRRVDSQDARDRRVAAELLERIKPPVPDLPKLLQPLLADEDPFVRRVATDILARIDPLVSGLTELLRPLLADTDVYVRRAAMQGLARQGPRARAALNDLEKASDDPNLLNRVAARVALIRIAGASKERVAAVADFLRLEEPCDGAAAYAADQLGKLGRQARAAAPQLLDALKHRDASVRGAAAFALGGVGADAKKAVGALIDLLNSDPEQEVRRSSAVALGKMGPAAAPAIPALRKVLRGEGGGWWIAADAIGKIGGPDAVPALVQALENKNGDVRLTASRRLGDLGGAAASAAEALKKARQDDPLEWNRKAAAEALRKIASREIPKK